MQVLSEESWNNIHSDLHLQTYFVVLTVFKVYQILF